MKDNVLCKLWRVTSVMPHFISKPINVKGGLNRLALLIIVYNKLLVSEIGVYVEEDQIIKNVGLRKSLLIYGVS